MTSGNQIYFPAKTVKAITIVFEDGSEMPVTSSHTVIIDNSMVSHVYYLNEGKVTLLERKDTFAKLSQFKDAFLKLFKQG